MFQPRTQSNPLPAIQKKAPEASQKTARSDKDSPAPIAEEKGNDDDDIIVINDDDEVIVIVSRGSQVDILDDDPATSLEYRLADNVPSLNGSLSIENLIGILTPPPKDDVYYEDTFELEQSQEIVLAPSTIEQDELQADADETTANVFDDDVTGEAVNEALHDVDEVVHDGIIVDDDQDDVYEAESGINDTNNVINDGDNDDNDDNDDVNGSPHNGIGEPDNERNEIASTNSHHDDTNINTNANEQVSHSDDNIIELNKAASEKTDDDDNNNKQNVNEQVALSDDHVDDHGYEMNEVASDRNSVTHEHQKEHLNVEDGDNVTLKDQKEESNVEDGNIGSIGEPVKVKNGYDSDRRVDGDDYENDFAEGF